MPSLSDRYSDGFGIAKRSQTIAVTAPVTENSLSHREQNVLRGAASTTSSRNVAREPRDGVVTAPRRCESCGQFVSKRHLKTARYFFDLGPSDRELTVYSLATATKLHERLHCAGCSMACCRLEQAERGYGIVIGLSLPNGWRRCTNDSTRDRIVYLDDEAVSA